MKILNLKINNFGKISNKEIDLKPNINVIYGENESGKSTLLKFILGMFYGVSKNKNGKFTSDYEKYTPWNEKEFSGKLKYNLDNGKQYEIFREFKKKNPKIYNSEMQDISNEFNIDKTLGNQFFVEQTNVDEELFLSTIVSEQEAVKLDDKEQNVLVQKMSNLVSTGEDNVSFNKVINKLNKKQLEEIGTSRSQDRPINIVMKRMEEIYNEKEELSKYVGKNYEIEEENKQLEEKIKQQEANLEILKELKQLNEQKELEQKRIKINEETIKEYENKIENLKNDNSDFNSMSVLEKNKMKKINKVKYLVIVILFLCSLLSIFILKNDIITAITLTLAIILSIYTGYEQYRKKSEKIETQSRQNVENHVRKNEIEVLENSIKRLKNDVSNANEKMEKDYKNNIEKIRNKYIGIVPIKTIDELLKKEAVIYEVSRLQNQISEDKVKLHSTKSDKMQVVSKLENLSELEEEYATLEERYNELYSYNEAINMAKEELEIAYNTMKKSITPKFTNNLSNIIDKISDGKYKNVQFNEENGIIVEIENGDYILAKNLSTGTIDQLYLSLRLGAGEEISEENMPIILDETFAYCDNKRLENILKYIMQEYKNRQIILFTCTNREIEILEKLKEEYNLIKL